MRGLAVIHPSAIICTGIKEVVKSYFNIEVLTFQEIQTFLANVPDFNTLVILTAPLGQKEINQLNRLGKSNQISIICLTWPEEKCEDSSLYDFKISIWAPASEYYDVLAPLLHKPQERLQTDKDRNELTIREKEVLQSIALGLTNKEMADKLHISIHTVISHRKNITAKLGIKSISGLTVYAILNKLVDTDTIDPETLI